MIGGERLQIPFQELCGDSGVDKKDIAGIGVSSQAPTLIPIEQKRKGFEKRIDLDGSKISAGN